MNDFRPHPTLADDLDTTIVRIEKSQMQRLGINEGDTVRVMGSASTGAVCHSMEDGFKAGMDSDIFYSSEERGILPQLRAGILVLNNLAPHGGTVFVPIGLEKVCDGTNAAGRVCLMPEKRNTDTGKFDKRRLYDLIVCRGNRLRFPDSDPGNKSSFLVTRVEPSDYSQITKDTEIEFVPFDPGAFVFSLKPLKPEGLRKVVPIAYEERIGNVTLTIPSLEIYNNGIKFRVLVRGSYVGYEKFTHGCANLVVALQGDAENRIALADHGRGSSISHTEFEYEHDFSARPLPPETRHVTITVRELAIQEQFSRPDVTSRPNHTISDTKENYEKIAKPPSFLIISGPWVAKARLDS